LGRHLCSAAAIQKTAKDDLTVGVQKEQEVDLRIMQAVVGQAAGVHAVIYEVGIARGHKGIDIVSGRPEVGQISQAGQLIGYSIESSLYIDLCIALLQLGKTAL